MTDHLQERPLPRGAGLLTWRDGVAAGDFAGHRLTIHPTLPPDADQPLTPISVPRWFVMDGPRLIGVVVRQDGEPDDSLWIRVVKACPWSNWRDGKAAP